MAVNLRGPVGRRGRVANVANFASDQAQVIDLLSSVPASKGGKAEAWANPPLAGPDGACPQFVADAIWDFQSFWKGRGVFHNIDGVVDPGGHTLAQLNDLADGGSGVAAFAVAAAGAGAAGGAGAALSGVAPGSASGVAGATAQTTSVDAFTRGLQQEFGFATDWSFTGSAGGGGGFGPIAAGGGTLKFANARGDTGGVSFGFLGGTIGFDQGPDFTFSYSTAKMWSAAVGNIRSRTADPLTLDDFTGPMFVFSFTAISSLAAGNGGSMTIYMLGVPTVIAVGGLLYPPMMLSCASLAADHAKAIGVMVGTAKGVDASVTCAPGYARLL